MARGDRFKRRLPPFIGRIPDFLDLFIAEDIEFERVDELLKDMGYSLNAHTIPRMKNPQGDLERYEKDYGLVKKGTIEDRVQAILRKIRLQNPTTEEAVLNICKSYGYQAEFERKYDQYGFIVWLTNTEGYDHSLVLGIKEAKPAHLTLIMGFRHNHSIYYGFYGRKSKHIEALPVVPEDKQEDLITTYGAMIARRQIKRKAIMPDVWTTNENSMFLEVQGDERDRIHYGGDSK